MTLVVVRANVRDHARDRAIVEAQSVADRFTTDSLSLIAFQFWGQRGKAAGNRLGFVDDFFHSAVGERGGTHVVLYSPGGLATYARDRNVIGSTFARPALIERALKTPQYDVSGGIESAFVPVESSNQPGTMLGVLRLERDYGPIAADIRHDFLTQAVTVAAALLLLYLTMLPLMRRVTRSLRRAYIDRSELAAIVDHSNDAIIAHTPTGAITSWNTGAERIYGWKSDEVIGRDIELLLPPDRSESALPFGLDLSRTTHQRKDGQPVQVSVTVSPVRDPSGAIVGASLTARDVTQLAELEHELQELHRQEAIARLAGDVAHDFDRILREIDVAVAKADRGAIERATARGEALVRQLLEIGGVREATPVLLDLNDAVRAVLPEIRELVGPFVTLDTQLEPNLGSVVADTAHVSELILSLAANARATMQSGGKLEILTANVDFSRRTRDGAVSNGRHVMIAFADSEPAVVARPADPVDAGGRVALGLAAACAIVRRHGGTLGTEMSPDGGTVIRVYLPRADAHDRELLNV